MELVQGIENIKQPYRNAVVTIGNFDGVHIGHQALFHEVIERSQAIKGTSVAMTFEPHPLRVLRKGAQPPLITVYDQKVELISRSGIDILICIPFTLDFASISASDFLQNILLRQIGMKVIVVGGDYAFGRNREGDLHFLKRCSKEKKFELIVADWIQTRANGSGRISSTRIRELVMNGEVATAQKMLGRYYQIRGMVEHGRNRGGRLLGFPTANIRLSDELAPKMGVYAIIVECLNQRFKGVANIGYSPTFNDHVYTVEAHLLDFSGDIYGQNIRVNFVERLRDEKKFSGIQELSAQIGRDIQKAREILSI